MSILRRLFFGREPQQLQHPVFGKLLLITTKTGAYWEGEPTVEGESIGLALETTKGEPPTEQQVEFYQRIINDLDATFSLAAPLLVPEYEKWLRAKFPENWREAFKFSGVSVPVGGLSSNPWELSCECISDRAGHLFTCYFEHGIPTHVSIDG